MNWSELAPEWPQRRARLGRMVFTNGCFDVLHRGHVAYLQEARELGASLVVGLNSDRSVVQLKGPGRPIVAFPDRAFVLAGLRSVDLVVGFDDATPAQLIEALGPDVLVKGGDWEVAKIVGSESVLRRGGEVRSLAFHQGNSTSGIVETILERGKCGLLP